MVRRQDQHHIVAVPLGGKVLGRAADCRGGVLAQRLEDDAAVTRQAEILDLAPGHEAMLLADHDNGQGRVLEGCHPLHRGLQQGEIAGQVDHLLGIEFAGQRPEPGTGATGQDDGLKGHRITSG